MSDIKVTLAVSGTLALETKEMRALMRGAANDVKTKTGRLIARSSGAGATYAYAGQRHRASAPGDPPARLSGQLKQSLAAYVFPSAMGFAVRARQFYALFLEAGARGGGNQFGGRPHAGAAWKQQRRRHHAKGRYGKRVLLPRPFLDRVMTEQANDLKRRVELAIKGALKWKEVRKA